MTEAENHTIRLLQEMRAAMDERFRLLDEKIDKIDARMDEVVRTQGGMLQLLSAQDSRLLRIEGDISTIKKRLNLVEA